METVADLADYMRAGACIAVTAVAGAHRAATYVSVQSSYSTHPSDHMSLLYVYGWLVQTSGAM